MSGRLEMAKYLIWGEYLSVFLFVFMHITCCVVHTRLTLLFVSYPHSYQAVANIYADLCPAQRDHIGITRIVIPDTPDISLVLD